MPKVIIHSINKQGVLSDRKYQYIIDNLGKPLDMCDFSFHKGNVSTITVDGPGPLESGKDICTTLFPESHGNDITYTVHIDESLLKRR